jgi:hypothetical protein
MNMWLLRFADGVHLMLHGVVHFLHGNCPQAIGLVKNAVIPAWTAGEFGPNHDLILRAPRTVPLRPLRAEDGYYWNV